MNDQISKENSNDTSDILIPIQKQFDHLQKDEFNRSSNFKGVSKNGNNWQIMAMIDCKKHYFGILQN